MSETQVAPKARKSQAKAGSGKKATTKKVAKNKSTEVVVNQRDAEKAVKEAEKLLKQAKKQLAREDAERAQAKKEAAKAHKKAKKAAAKADRKRRAYKRAKSRSVAMRKMKGPRWVRRLRWEARRAWAKAKRAWRKARGKAKVAAAFAAGWATKTAWPTAKTWVVRYSVPAWAWVKAAAISTWTWSAPARVWAAVGFGSVAGMALFGAQIAFIVVVAAAVLVMLTRTKKGKQYLGRVEKDLNKANTKLRSELKTIEATKKQLKAAKTDLETVVAEAKAAPNLEPIVVHDEVGGEGRVVMVPVEGTEPDWRDEEMERRDNSIALNSAQEEAVGKRVTEVGNRKQSFEQKGDQAGYSEYAGREYVAMERLVGHGDSMTKLNELFRGHFEGVLGAPAASEKFNWTAVRKGIQEEIKLIDKLLKDNEGKSARRPKQDATV